MIEFSNGARLVQDVAELPPVPKRINRLYGDFETISGDKKIASTNPWHNCDVAGICVTWDDVPGAWYVPIGHYNGGNLDRETVIDWWCDVVTATIRWVNQNIKYDAHVSTNWLGVLPECQLDCTLTSAKIIDSDRMLRGGYSLKALAKGWLKENIDKYDEALQPWLHRNKDYGVIPADIMAQYGCQDVMTNRRLSHFIESRMPPDCAGVRQTELELTSILFQMERNGLKIDPLELKIKNFQILNRMIEIDAELAAIVGHSFRPHVRDDCFDVLCNQYGLDVMKWTNEGDDDKPHNPSFDKEALAKYAAHPYAPQDVVSRIIEYRNLHTLKNLFIEPYQVLHDEGFLHCSYNQAVRTGRMSCGSPNMQQLSGDAKRLVHPRDGHTFLSIDYSQIEFRVIAHYIKDFDIIKAYNINPDTDFHAWVAEMSQMARKPAKTMNFMMGYGGGKAKAVKTLASNSEVVGDIKAQVERLVESGQVDPEKRLQHFNRLCEQRAEKVYNEYHATLPGLKRTSRRAAQALKRKGYVFNLYGRHRHLPDSKAHIAFNAICQSSAADLMKERTVAVAKHIEGTGVLLVANVHDEILFEVPDEVFSKKLIEGIVDVMEKPECEISVPIRCSVGWSKNTWKDAGAETLPMGEKLLLRMRQESL